MRRFVCGHCQQPLEWNWRIGGTSVGCTACGKETLAPVLESEFVEPAPTPPVPSAGRSRWKTVGRTILRTAGLLLLIIAIRGVGRIAKKVDSSSFNFQATPPAQMSPEEQRQLGEYLLERSRLAKSYIEQKKAKLEEEQQRPEKVLDESVLPAPGNVAPLFPP
jgi:hypothetical protein